MNLRTNPTWIPIERIDSALQIETALIISALALTAWIVYRFFLKSISDERHRNVQKLFVNLLVHFSIATSLFVFYSAVRELVDPTPEIRLLSGYLGLLALSWGIVVFIKTARILIFEYLFIGHLQKGVPVLLVNLFTVVLTLFLSGWIATEIFSVRVTSILATSAIFSVVLGLALQDTLGNLLAGAALQFDKPYEIGDWVEIHTGSQKWTGQVLEISWRATVLIGFSDEHITITNRVVAQSQVSNFSSQKNPIVRSQILRIPYDTPQDQLREVLVTAALSAEGVRKYPAPFVLLNEAGESYITLKIVYFIDDYGRQYLIGDQVLTQALGALSAAGIQTARPQLSLSQV